MMTKMMIEYADYGDGDLMPNSRVEHYLKRSLNDCCEGVDENCDCEGNDDLSKIYWKLTWLHLN